MQSSAYLAAALALTALLAAAPRPAAAAPHPCDPAGLEVVTPRVREMCAALFKLNSMVQDYLIEREPTATGPRCSAQSLQRADPKLQEWCRQLGALHASVWQYSPVQPAAEYPVLKRQDVDHVFLRFGRR